MVSVPGLAFQQSQSIKTLVSPKKEPKTLFKVERKTQQPKLKISNISGQPRLVAAVSVSHIKKVSTLLNQKAQPATVKHSSSSGGFVVFKKANDSLDQLQKPRKLNDVLEEQLEDSGPNTHRDTQHKSIELIDGRKIMQNSVSQ